MTRLAQFPRLCGHVLLHLCPRAPLIQYAKFHGVVGLRRPRNPSWPRASARRDAGGIEALPTAAPIVGVEQGAGLRRVQLGGRRPTLFTIQKVEIGNRVGS